MCARLELAVQLWSATAFWGSFNDVSDVNDDVGMTGNMSCAKKVLVSNRVPV